MARPMITYLEEASCEEPVKARSKAALPAVKHNTGRRTGPFFARRFLMALIRAILLLIGGVTLFQMLSVHAATPTLTNVSPNNGPIAGGTVITVTGSGFRGQYERVEALIFRGGSYIDTSVSQMNHFINVRFQMNTSDSTTTNAVFGNGNASGTANMGLARSPSGTLTAYKGSGSATVATNLIKSGRNDFTLDWDVNAFHINGSQVTISSTPNAAANIWIGGSASPSGTFRGEFFVMKTFVGTVLDHHFVPVRNTTTGEYGVVDLMTGAFTGNAGTGTIGGGSTVNDVFVEDAVIVGALSPDTQTQVLIDGRPCTGVNIVSDTELTCHTPSGLSLGKKNVTVDNGADGSSTMVDGFEYALRLNAIYPRYGEPTGGNTINIDGGVYSRPPEQYRSVEGIVFDGTSWIESGFNQIGSTKVVLDFTYGVTGCTGFNMGMLGGRNASSGDGFVVWGCTGNNMRTDYGTAGSNTYPISNFGTTNRFTLLKDNGLTQIYDSDGTLRATIANQATLSLATPVEMLIGSLNHGGAYGTNGATQYSSFQGTIYGAKICKAPANIPAGTVTQRDDATCGTDRVLVRNLIPAMRETDGTYGFYDMVTGEFMENAGFGRFTKSGDTETNELEVPLVLDVQVGNQTCTDPTLVSPTRISCVVPASNLPGDGTGRVDVSVTANGVAATPGSADADDYYYGSPMVVDAITPNRGTIAGGQAVEITGSNFFPLNYDPATQWTNFTVTIGGSPCAITDAAAITNTTITCTTTAHSGGISDVYVNNGDGEYLYGGSVDPITGAVTSGYLYEDELVSVSPVEGPTLGGTDVTIRGNNFLLYGSTTRVYFGGAMATNVTVVNSTTITARTPPHAPGVVDILVLQDGYAASLDRTATSAFEYFVDEATGNLSPNRGYISGGDTVTITGTGFDPSPDANTTVTFDGEAALDVVVIDETMIRLVTPPHTLGRVDVVITQYGVPSTFENAFTYVNPLTINTISPSSGVTEGGTLVTIGGESFVPIEGTPASTFVDLVVTIGSAPCTVASVADYTNTQIRCTTSAHASGTVDVSVVSGEGPNHTGVLTNGYTYVAMNLSLSTNNLHIPVSPTSQGTGKVDLAVQTDSSTGYILLLRADDSNSTTANDNWIKCTDPGSTARYQSITAPGALTANTWGWGAGELEPSSWLPVPVIDTPLVEPIPFASGPQRDGAETDLHSVWYGVNSGWEQPHCTYVARIVITLVAQ